jgi:hypothetical protein
MICRVSASTAAAVAGSAQTGTLNPWHSALRALAALPSAVRGPLPRRDGFGAGLLGAALGGAALGGAGLGGAGLDVWLRSGIESPIRLSAAGKPICAFASRSHHEAAMICDHTGGRDHGWGDA